MSHSIHNALTASAFAVALFGFWLCLDLLGIDGFVAFGAAYAVGIIAFNIYERI